jgi:hypothetical protein
MGMWSSMDLLLCRVWSLGGRMIGRKDNVGLYLDMPVHLKKWR